MKKIYCFCNTRSPGWYVVLALCEDGVCLGLHASSTEAFAKLDIGYLSDEHYRHEDYREHCPDGYELVWVDDPKSHDGVMAAYARNQAMREGAIS